jgi:Nif-specific ferredoxin III
MLTGKKCGGSEWVPKFILAIDVEKCIGCGRCYKACGRDVLALIEKPFEGDDDFGDDMGNKVMSIMSRGDCIGCGACGRACTKKCHSYEAIEG